MNIPLVDDRARLEIDRSPTGAPEAADSSRTRPQSFAASPSPDRAVLVRAEQIRAVYKAKRGLGVRADEVIG